MENTEQKQIDIAKVLAAKGIKPRRWIVRLLNRILHVDEINEALALNDDKEGAEFAQGPIRAGIKMDTIP